MTRVYNFIFDVETISSTLQEKDSIGYYQLKTDNKYTHLCVTFTVDMNARIWKVNILNNIRWAFSNHSSQVQNCQTSHFIKKNQNHSTLNIQYGNSIEVMVLTTYQVWYSQYQEKKLWMRIPATIIASYEFFGLKSLTLCVSIL